MMNANMYVRPASDVAAVCSLLDIGRRDIATFFACFLLTAGSPEFLREIAILSSSMVQAKPSECGGIVMKTGQKPVGVVAA